MVGTERTGAKILNSVKRTCERLDLGVTTIYRLLKTNQLEAVRIGGKTLITEASILRLAQHGTDSDTKVAA